ncbi:mitochondrial intermediate peptidase-like protein mitochondrial precursor [Tothia fuscella]|uniref:Mitochondrial intermediate peptidase n=1 Tax=Tothia fuscella TaxID=1048955 RepID=A0A9P4NZ71_9PEZI|nr:mitochondrial intermediate peptidase-like protein mitochondrial precursor [Tothia fuscella]
MLKGLRRQPWTCSRCLRAAQRRTNTSISTASIPKLYNGISAVPTSFASTDTQHDDTTLRQIFDSQPFWKEFSQKGSGQHAGLFLNKYLTKPAGFKAYTDATLVKCHAVVDKILSAETVDEYKSMARDMDRLSDLLCRVIDLADFVRSTHPDGKFQHAATMAYTAMFEYMNELNTTTGLNDQLKKASSIPEVWNSWTEEEQVVAGILMRDFSKSAIDLPDEARRGFVEISSEIADVGTDFVDHMAPEKAFLSFDSSRMKGMDASLARNLTRWGKVTLPTQGTPAVMALRTVEDDDVRREVYMAHRTASKGSIHRLEKLLKARARLAKLSGYETFAHMSLSDKMAKTPEAVNQFLQALLADTRPQLQSELQDLIELKKSDAHNENFPSRINAWDRDYYTTRLLASLSTKIHSPDTLSAFFSLGTVFQGLSRLFNRLYGIRLVPREPMIGETWNDDVRRLDVVDDTNQRIAVVYCDLFSRAGKSPNPAHFTLRCSREIFPDEIAEYASTPHQPFPSPVETATDGMAHAISPSTGTILQLPTIALICDFARPSPKPSKPNKPTLLTFRDVQTLFHEMGHAVHSILGRTSLQNVSGTRCATDFAELPSVLMEHFAFAPEVLDLWATHWESGQKIPFALVQERLDAESRMAGAETESQILLAILDQEYHSLKGGRGAAIDSTKVYHDVFSTYASIPEPPGTAWQGFFGHLYGYGATYYSYLFDRAIARRVWDVVFKGGVKAVDRSAGEKLKSEVLRWGGGRDGWKCVAGVLGDTRLSEGGEEAMKEVGRWGIRERGRK